MAKPAVNSVLQLPKKGVRGPFPSGLPSKSKQTSVRFFSIKPIIDNRPLVRDHLRRTSVVYAKKTPPFTGTRLGQRQVNELRLKDWARYKWTLPPVPPGRVSRSCSSGVNHPAPSRSTLSQDAREGDNCAETTRSLPPLRLSAFGQPMLRRPTTRCLARPEIGVGDELLNMLGNYLDLVPINSQGQSDEFSVEVASTAFYNHHFPLIMQTGRCSAAQEDDNKVVRVNPSSARETGKVKQAKERRWAPPSQCWPERSEVSNASFPYDQKVSHRQMMNRQSSEQKRKADLNRRCMTLERALTSLERGGGADDTEKGDHVEEEGDVFVTELREDTFDPRSWPWNEGRYQM